MSSLDRILPFLKPIEDLLLDHAVTEVMVNDGGRHVFVERDGALEPVVGRTLETRNLTVAIKNIARACGDEISEMQPLLDARLEDGSRVAAMFPPCAVAGPVLTIRKFTQRYSLDDLVGVGTMTPDVATHLRCAVASQQNILISGGTGTGKTTLLNALAALIPDQDRIVVIEETAEIHLEKPNLVRLEARRAQAPLGHEAPLPPVTIADLLRATLRHRPDRILVGEVRGAEAFDSAAGAEHRPSGQSQHHSRELAGPGAGTSRALRLDGERRPAARQHPRSHRARHPSGRPPRSRGRPQTGHRNARGPRLRDGERPVPVGPHSQRARTRRSARMTRSATRGFLVLIVGLTSACGGGSPGPTGPSGSQSFLAGTWQGTVTIQVAPGPSGPQPATVGFDDVDVRGRATDQPADVQGDDPFRELRGCRLRPSVRPPLSRGIRRPHRSVHRGITTRHAGAAARSAASALRTPPASTPTSRAWTATTSPSRVA